MMRFYKDPLEAYRISFEEYKKLSQKIKDRMWARYDKHIDARQFRGLFQAFYAHNAQTKAIKYNYPNAISEVTL